MPGNEASIWGDAGYDEIDEAIKKWDAIGQPPVMDQLPKRDVEAPFDQTSPQQSIESLPQNREIT